MEAQLIKVTQVVGKEIKTISKRTDNKLIEALSLSEKIGNSEVPSEVEPLDETPEHQQHKHNVALANILTLLSTAAASHLSNAERLEIKELVRTVMTKNYDSSEPMDQDDDSESS